MNFKEWIIEESSLNDLYQSAVESFPNCRKRQHSIDEITITRLEWVTYRGMRTLFIKGLAQNRGNGHQYSPIILFKNVQYHNEAGENIVEITDNNGVQHFLEKLSNVHTEALVRCNCADFAFRFNYYNSISDPTSLYGRKRAPYQALGVGPPANPTESEGVCKHLIKMAKVLQQANLID